MGALPGTWRHNAALAFDPAGRTLGVVTAAAVDLWDLAAGRRLRSLAAPDLPTRLQFEDAQGIDDRGLAHVSLHLGPGGRVRGGADRRRRPRDLARGRPP